jgi:hypothetical protein
VISQDKTGESLISTLMASIMEVVNSSAVGEEGEILMD